MLMDSHRLQCYNQGIQKGLFMPSLPPKPCCTPRCHKMATKRGKCEDHQPEAWVSSKGKTAEERGYGHKWKKIRKQALVRDGYLCQECLKNDRLTVATDVDHVINKAQGGTDALSNLQCLCRPCHKIKTIKERTK